MALQNGGLRIKKGEGAAEWRITDYGLRIKKGEGGMRPGGAEDGI
jgi:hypothetical protein